MTELISPFLIGIGQTAAVLVYLLYGDRDALRERPARWAYTAGFYLLLSLAQARLHLYLSAQGTGSLPTLPFLALSWLLYALFLVLWSRAPWTVCCFLAFVLMLADNCIWPLVSTVSRMLWGVNYLYDGRFLLRIPFILALSALECALAYGIRRLLPEMRKIHLTLYDTVLAAAIVIPFLYIRTLSGQSLSQDNKLVQIIMTVCCLVAVITLAAEIGHSSSEHEERREEQMQSVLRQQQAMFEQKLQDADSLNRKYHDMKNFLLYLRAHEGGGQELDSSIDQLMKSIEPYGNAVSTGNTVVDVILGEKLAVCAEEGIVCVPYLDGSLLDFVKPLDLCTLIGNAMDNAIESCCRIPERERRHIRLHSVQRGETVVLTVRNTFDRAPDFRGGLPATTKEDAGNHGYGLRNMQYLAESYGGTLSCRIENEEFVLTIVLQRDAAV
ncbi:MAG: GHKL domain-containing protein [Oscillospiraceae bacterium]|nr:GHKL domain-containing protein [Oscillospiraceae bacterium]